jgi:hypothetical protein
MSLKIEKEEEKKENYMKKRRSNALHSSFDDLNKLTDSMFEKEKEIIEELPCINFYSVFTSRI